MKTTLPTVQLGGTGMEVTRVGLGAWAMGGGGWTSGWGAQDDDESVAAIRFAVENGVTWIDTASVYGLGHSEEIVARALMPYPEEDRPLVFTKGGLFWDDTDHSKKPRRIGDPAVLRQQVEDSLRRLNVERIDLYQMHRPAEDGHGVAEYWGLFRDLVDEGKVRAAGLSNHDAQQLAEAEEVGRVDVVQPRLNLLHRESAAEIIPWCASRGRGVVVYSPMASGLLTGSFSEDRASALERDDWRRSSPDFFGDGLRRNLGLAAALRPIAERYSVGVGCVAIAWTLAVDGVSAAIVGARRPAQVLDWLPAAALELSDVDLDEIAVALGRWGTGEGPARP